jgi:hypothetical protein
VSSYDDGEDLPTPDDGFAAEHADVIAAIRTISDPATRRAVMAVFVLAVLHGRVGR